MCAHACELEGDQKGAKKELGFGLAVRRRKLAKTAGTRRLLFHPLYRASLGSDRSFSCSANAGRLEGNLLQVARYLRSFPARRYWWSDDQTQSQWRETMADAVD